MNASYHFIWAYIVCIKAVIHEVLPKGVQVVKVAHVAPGERPFGGHFVGHAPTAS